MNANNKFLAEARELGRLWAKTGLLKNLPKTASGVLLESQRLVNEMPVLDLDVAHGVMCDKCGDILDYFPPLDFDLTLPKRMVCRGCKKHFQAGWDEAEDMVRAELTGGHSD